MTGPEPEEPASETPAVQESPVDVLRRWEASGAVWRVVARSTAGLDVALLTCDAGEQVGRVRSDDPGLARYVGDRDGSDD